MAMTMKRAGFAAVLAALLASCSGDDSSPHGAPDAGDNNGGNAGHGGTGGDGGGVVGLLPVAATVTAFSTLGEPRTGDGLTLSADGFELGERLCTANGLFCVTGGFGP